MMISSFCFLLNGNKILDSFMHLTWIAMVWKQLTAQQRTQITVVIRSDRTFVLLVLVLKIHFEWLITKKVYGLVFQPYTGLYLMFTFCRLGCNTGKYTSFVIGHIKSIWSIGTSNTTYGQIEWPARKWWENTSKDENRWSPLRAPLAI